VYTDRIYYLDEVFPEPFTGIYHAFHMFCMSTAFHNNCVHFKYHMRVKPFIVNDGMEEIQAVFLLGPVSTTVKFTLATQTHFSYNKHYNQNYISEKKKDALLL
jgi:hypothetical protein